MYIGTVTYIPLRGRRTEDFYAWQALDSIMYVPVIDYTWTIACRSRVSPLVRYFLWTYYIERPVWWILWLVLIFTMDQSSTLHCICVRIVFTVVLVFSTVTTWIYFEIPIQWMWLVLTFTMDQCFVLLCIAFLHTCCVGVLYSHHS